MRDERRNSGEYYPGGRVIARPGTAPQQVVVQWSDVQNKPQVAPLPDRYRESDMKGKINEIASKFATMAVAAFIVWTACADVTVQKKRKDEIYNDELVVVDVTGGGSGGIDTNAVERIANAAVETNAVTVGLVTATNDLSSSKLDKTDPVLTPTAPSVDASDTALAGAQATGAALERKLEQETDPTVPDWAKTEYPFHIYSDGGAEVITYGNDVYIYGANVFHGDIPMIDNIILMDVLRDYIAKDPEHQTGNIPVFSTDGGLADSGFTTDDISGKADKVSGATGGNLAALDGDGNLADSGKSESDFATAYQVSILARDVGLAMESLTHKLDAPDSTDVTEGHVAVFKKVTNPDETVTVTVEDGGELPVISATDETFANAVLAVGLNIDTNSVAVLNEIAATFGGFPITGTATTVGGLLAALAAAVAWLKKTKVQTLKLNDGSIEKTAENGVAKLDDFFKESNSLLMGVVRYPINAEATVKDRAINVVTDSPGVTVPDAFTDLLIRASVTNTTSLPVTMPTAITTVYGDNFPGETGEFLVTITKTGAAEAYVRTIKLEVPDA